MGGFGCGVGRSVGAMGGVAGGLGGGETGCHASQFDLFSERAQPTLVFLKKISIYIIVIVLVYNYVLLLVYYRNDYLRVNSVKYYELNL